MRRYRVVSLVIPVLVMGCSKPSEDVIETTPTNAVHAKTPGPVDLHFALAPAPCLLEGQNQLPLPELSVALASRKTTVTKWTVYFPDDVPVNTAIELFAQFEKAECTNVAVYAEDARGDCAKRDICLDVGPSGPVQVVTEFRQNYPDALKQYVGKHGQDLLAAKCRLNELAPVLRPLLAMCKKKHVRLMETGGLQGMPGKRYLEVLDVLKQLGVEQVSFYGVYLE